MPALRILVVEDEWIIAENMASKLRKAGYEVTACVDTCQDALQSVKTDPPDLIFLDIMLSGEEDGIETARQIKTLGNFPFIFLTNLHDPGTLKRARAVNPANYLLKPFDERQLNVSIQQAMYNLEQQAQVEPGNSSDKLPAEIILNDSLFIRDLKGSFKKYQIADILFIEADRAYSTLYMSNGEVVTQSVSMNKLREKIQHPDFVQVHRSHIVNISKIEEIKGNILVVRNHEVPVSEAYREPLFKRIRLL